MQKFISRFIKKKNGRKWLQPLKKVKTSHIVIAAAALFLFVVVPQSRRHSPSVINKANLEKIINVSDLSTFEAVYNGIAEVKNKKNPDLTDYFVTYDAKVKAGINFEAVKISVNEESKTISVDVPEIKITDVNVDIGSLDYIFWDHVANTSTVSSEAFQHCIEDATRESRSETAIYDLAKQNAHNIIEALIRPFITSLDEDYQLKIN